MHRIYIRIATIPAASWINNAERLASASEKRKRNDSWYRCSGSSNLSRAAVLYVWRTDIETGQKIRVTRVRVFARFFDCTHSDLYEAAIAE